MIIKRVIETHEDINFSFKDFQKTFHMVKYKKMMEMLQDIGIDGMEMRLIRNLYRKKKPLAQVGDSGSSWDSF